VHSCLSRISTVSPGCAARNAASLPSTSSKFAFWYVAPWWIVKVSPSFTRARMSIMRIPAVSCAASVLPLSPKSSWACVHAPPWIAIVSCVPAMERPARLRESARPRIQSGLAAALSVR
jgi:hypothetical protein